MILGPEFDLGDHGDFDADEFRRAARLMVERMAEAVTGFIDGAEPRQRRAWLVTDFITLGSPLAHAPYLMCKGKSAASHRQDFDRRVREFEFPTSPPARANGGGRLTIVDPQTNRRHFHHGAQFGLTRWTNLYFPMSELLWEDAVGGPLGPIFGNTVLDVPVHTSKDMKSRFFAHTAYWILSSSDGASPAPHIEALRKAINFADDRA